jgi:hypothetical protein
MSQANYDVGKKKGGYEIYTRWVGEHYRERFNKRQQEGPDAENETKSEMKLIHR